MTDRPDDADAAPLAPPMPWGDPPPRGWEGGMLRRAAPAGPLVLKIGGSLLVRRDWPALVAGLVATVSRPAAASGAARARGGGGRSLIVVVGGGAIVDGLRAIDAAAPRDERLVHELAIEAMRLTARLVADATGLPIAAAAAEPAAALVLDVPAWLAAGDRAAALPAGWHVTSDSIAALVAVTHDAGLLMAKSLPPPPCPAGDPGLGHLAAAGWVDDHFAAAAGPLRSIGWAAPAGDGTGRDCRSS